MLIDWTNKQNLKIVPQHENKFLFVLKIWSKIIGHMVYDLFAIVYIDISTHSNKDAVLLIDLIIICLNQLEHQI